MGGDGVHADGGIANQRQAVADEAGGVDGDQGVEVAGADEVHVPQAGCVALGDFGVERRLRQRGEAGGLLGWESDDEGALVAVQRQDGDGLADAEPFGGDGVVRQGVRHAADQHGFAEIQHAGGDADAAAHFGKAGVCGDDQAGGNLGRV